MKLNSEKLRAFETAIKSMAEFKRVFGRDLKPDFIAELYAAREFDLDLVSGSNEPGYDTLHLMARASRLNSETPKMLIRTTSISTSSFWSTLTTIMNYLVCGV